ARLVLLRDQPGVRGVQLALPQRDDAAGYVVRPALLQRDHSGHGGLWGYHPGHRDRAGGERGRGADRAALPGLGRGRRGRWLAEAARATTGASTRRVSRRTPPSRRRLCPPLPRLGGLSRG